MKKYILSLCALVSIGQCYPMQDAQAHQALTNLTKTINSTNIKTAPQKLFDTWKQTISSVTQYAIENSKNMLGQKDENLIIAVANILSINDIIIALYQNLQNDIFSGILKRDNSGKISNAYKTKITELTKSLNENNTVLNITHQSLSKKKAQSVLRQAIKSLQEILKKLYDIVDNNPIILH